LRQLSRPPASLWTAGRLPRGDERLVATFAVFGDGVDVVDPDRRGPLFGDIAREGGLMSRYLAGTPRALQVSVAAPIDLALRMGATMPEVLAGLAEAELSGWARRLLGGRFEVLRAN
jgi:predicted Rossmann fold nucleotide-binding protein DprA/Smf involved in DNA uptake